MLLTPRRVCLSLAKIPCKNVRKCQHLALSPHGKKGFVIPIKSFVKIGITKIFCNNNKIFGSNNETLGCCSKILGCNNKKFICCPWFCCRNKTIFSVQRRYQCLLRSRDLVVIIQKTLPGRQLKIIAIIGVDSALWKFLRWNFLITLVQPSIS